MGKVMGIDYGSKRIGIALTDEEAKFAFPHGIVPTTPDALRSIKELIEQHEVRTVVIGESIDFSGNDNPLMQEARQFAGDLERVSGVQIFFEPETLTSAQAHRQHERSEKTRKPLVRHTIDASAAALILQSYLDKQT